MTTTIYVQDNEAKAPILGENDDPLEWLAEFQQVAKTNEWDEARSLKMVRRNVPASVLVWIDSQTEALTTMTALEAALYKITQTLAYLDKAFVEAESCKMKGGELLDAFTYRIEHIFKRANISDQSIKMRFFMRALPEDFHNFIVDKGAQDYNGTKAQAKVFEGRRLLRRYTEPSARTVSAPPALVPARRTARTNVAAQTAPRSNQPPKNLTVDDLATQLEKLSLQMVELQKAQPSTGSAPRSRNDLSHITCFNCQEKGHYANMCTQPRRTKESSSSQDSALGMIDAISRDESNGPNEVDLMAVTRSQSRAAASTTAVKKSATPRLAPKVEPMKKTDKQKVSKTVLKSAPLQTVKGKILQQ
ncbi:hypothetical protein BGW38_009142 [Lunasporangiospora selenospora]|uniref:CCHC-type domain-containing protein n=1 Tax=Lunasporangiospora selenospora TaxID=979761 RepID=A0A9P6K8S1_9FUNG|nr:hypothetical protein BGW38_009142 [Lunasporangiospora selenospora]